MPHQCRSNSRQQCLMAQSQSAGALVTDLCSFAIFGGPGNVAPPAVRLLAASSSAAAGSTALQNITVQPACGGPGSVVRRALAYLLCNEQSKSVLPQTAGSWPRVDQGNTVDLPAAAATWQPFRFSSIQFHVVTSNRQQSSRIKQPMRFTTKLIAPT